jgi:hypothetical protein
MPREKGKKLCFSTDNEEWDGLKDKSLGFVKLAAGDSFALASTTEHAVVVLPNPKNGTSDPRILKLSDHTDAPITKIVGMDGSHSGSDSFACILVEVGDKKVATTTTEDSATDD